MAKKRKKHHHKHRGRTGYTLHSRRLEYTGSPSKRSIKYPLKSESKEVFNFIAEAIKRDNLLVNGPINLDDWLFSKDKPVYSLIDFWLDTLRLGGFFQPDATKLADLAITLSGQQSTSEKIFNSIPLPLRSKLNKDKFIIEILQKGEVRSTSTPQSLGKRLLDCFKEDFQENEEALEIVDRLTSELIGLPRNRQKELKQKIFGYRLFAGKKPELSLTFYLNPHFAVDFDLKPVALLERLGKLAVQIEAKQETKMIKEWTFSLAGLTESYNAFQNYLNIILKLLQNKETDKIVKSMLQISGLWRGKEEELKKRLTLLSEKAKRLPEKPRLAKNWAAYRSVFGGKLQGWYSNYVKQVDEIKNDLPKRQNKLERIEKLLRSQKAEKKLSHVRKQLLFVLNKLLILHQEFLKGKKEFAKNYWLYTDLISRLRIYLNTLVQGNSGVFVELKKDKGSKSRKPVEEVTVKGLFPEISKRLSLIPNFYGASKKKRYQKYWQLGKLMTEGFQFLEGLEEKVVQGATTKIEQQYFKRQLDRLLQKRKTLNSNLYAEKIEKEILKYVDRFPSKQEVFYKSPYSKNKRLKEIKADLPGNLGAVLDELISLFNVKGEWEKLNAGQLVDLIEIQKLRWGWLLERYSVETLVKKNKINQFEKALSFLELVGENLKGKDLSYLVQSYILSEMKGAASLMSRREFIIRAHINPEKSDRSFPLLYIPKQPLESATSFPKEINEQTMVQSAEEFVSFNPGLLEMKYYPHQYAIKFDDLEVEGKPLDKSAILFRGKKKSSRQKIEKGDKVCLLNIASSPYQLQFLDWYLATPRKKGKTELSREETALILEQRYKVNWQGRPLVPRLQLKGKRLFASIPFSIVPKTEKREQSLLISGRKKYLGIDVGEYGLAWAVIQPKMGGVKLLEKGFIYEPGIKSIRDFVSTLKSNQVKGTFGVPSTKLARIRKTVINTLRNKVHDLVLKHNAKVIYELQISGFESGGNKVAKVYRSVKTADVYQENKADGSVMELAWGKGAKQIGNQVSAWATSQTCSACKKSVLNKINKGKEYQVLEREGNIISVELGKNETVRAYIENKTEKTIKGSELLSATQDYMRPPIDSEVSKKIGVKIPGIFKEKRGNSALFVCPFCGFVSDADIQAALHIAYRGYLNDNGKKDFFESLRKEKVYPKIRLNTAL